jgi:hypothetical protein
MIMMGNDQLLCEENYNFHVPSSGKEPYPICPSFEYWRFPHDNIPASWYSGVQLAPQPNNIPAANLSPAIINRDKSCKLTDYHDGLEGAHLCPRNEYPWFRRNGMAKYNLNRQLTMKDFTNDTSNVIALRADVHRVFDAYGFVLVRKGSNWVTHFLGSTVDLGKSLP